MKKYEGFYDGKWHVALPITPRYKNDEVGGIDMAGVDPAATVYIKNGDKLERVLIIEVESEDIYRQYCRLMWRCERLEAREKRCLVACKNGMTMRCPLFYNCAECPHNSEVNNRRFSLEQLNPDCSIAPDLENDLDPARIHEHSSFVDELTEYISTLDGKDQIIAKSILERRCDKDVMKELGIEKQSTYSYNKLRVKRMLQRRFAEWL